MISCDLLIYYLSPTPLKGLGHEDFAVLGQFCTKSLTYFLETSTKCSSETIRKIACVAGGIVRVRGKILTLESEYGRRSREENGKEPLWLCRENWRLRRHCLALASHARQYSASYAGYKEDIKRILSGRPNHNNYFGDL